VSSPLRWLSSRGLVTRLLVTQTLVLVVGLGTAWAVATLVGPPLFHEHLQQGGHSGPPTELKHVEAAFASASLIALGVALTIALVTAFVVSLYLTSRIQRPLSELAKASDTVARGRHVHVAAPRIGSEFDQVATAFNEMADRLDHVEDTRRRLLSDLAHELRTPVATLDGYLEGLEDGVVAWDEETARVLREQTSRLVRLVEDVGDVSRAEEGQLQFDLEDVPVAVLAESAVTPARDSFSRKGVDLLLEVDAGPADLVRVDRQRIAQVLANLLGNALRHTPPGGRVTVAAGRRDDERVVISVTDTGEGIDAHQLSHVFERFYRGDTARDRDHGGSGIGLTISQAIVTAHGGTLTAASDGVGRGARFEVTLPVSDDAARE
jgi:signal transduction histidine kinase